MAASVKGNKSQAVLKQLGNIHPEPGRWFSPKASQLKSSSVDGHQYSLRFFLLDDKQVFPTAVGLLAQQDSIGCLLYSWTHPLVKTTSVPWSVHSPTLLMHNCSNFTQSF